MKIPLYDPLPSLFVASPFTGKPNAVVSVVCMFVKLQGNGTKASTVGAYCSHVLGRWNVGSTTGDAKKIE